MGIETLWVIVSWAVVVGIGLPSAFVGYHWFVLIPDCVHPRPVEARSPAAPRGAAWR